MLINSNKSVVSGLSPQNQQHNWIGPHHITKYGGLKTYWHFDYMRTWTQTLTHQIENKTYNKRLSGERQKERNRSGGDVTSSSDRKDLEDLLWVAHFVVMAEESTNGVFDGLLHCNKLLLQSFYIFVTLIFTGQKNSTHFPPRRSLFVAPQIVTNVSLQLWKPPVNIKK